MPCCRIIEPQWISFIACNLPFWMIRNVYESHTRLGIVICHGQCLRSQTKLMALDFVKGLKSLFARNYLVNYFWWTFQWIATHKMITIHRNMYISWNYPILNDITGHGHSNKEFLLSKAIKNTMTMAQIL